MPKLFQLIKILTAVAVLQCAAPAAYAQSDKSEHVMDGTTINWSYNFNGATMVLSFAEGKAQYEWTSGGRKGNKAADIPYRSREIAQGIFQISWDQADRPDYITFIFDFNANLAFTSGLIGYGTDRQRNLFLDGKVNSVER